MDYGAEYLKQVDRNQTYKEVSYKMLGIESGQVLLDVGCGLGWDLERLLEVSGGGKFVGIDTDGSRLNEARIRLSEKLGAGLKLEKGDACAIPFQDGHFDRARADRVFQHLADPKTALGEMFRVLKPGGIAVVSEPDWGTLKFWNPDFPFFTEKAFSSFPDTLLRNGRIGGKLFSLFSKVGFLEVVKEIVVEKVLDFFLAREIFRLELIVSDAVERGLISGNDADVWFTHLEEAEDFEMSLAMFVVKGVKSR